MNANELQHCLNCGRSEEMVPLVNLRYSGNQAWICSQCLPTLIHRPGQLAGKMANAENFTPLELDE
jgi:hypothetical protein